MSGSNQNVIGSNNVFANNDEFENMLREVNLEESYNREVFNNIKLDTFNHENNSNFSNSSTLYDSSEAPPSLNSRSEASNADEGCSGLKGAALSAINHDIPVKLDELKSWSVSTYKCTRQLFAEVLGKRDRTLDVELEKEIAELRKTQNTLSQVLRFTKAFISHLAQSKASHQGLAGAFEKLILTIPDLECELNHNIQTQRIMYQSLETLTTSLEIFVSDLSTLIYKTMEDTFLTIRSLEFARLEYDAYRNDLDETVKQGISMQDMNSAKESFSQHKEKFDKLRSDVIVKLKLLHENKVKVLRRQLAYLTNILFTHHSNSAQALSVVFKQMGEQLDERVSSKTDSTPSWLNKAI